MKNFGTERILQRELQHSYICPHTLKVLTHRECRAKSILQKEKVENIDLDSRISKEDFKEPDAVEGLVSLNIAKDLETKMNTNSNDQHKRNRRNKTELNKNKEKMKQAQAGIDFTTVYLPNGKAKQKQPVNKAAL